MIAACYCITCSSFSFWYADNSMLRWLLGAMAEMILYRTLLPCSIYSVDISDSELIIATTEFTLYGKPYKMFSGSSQSKCFIRKIIQSELI
jgi:hypothetical protein